MVKKLREVAIRSLGLGSSGKRALQSEIDAAAKDRRPRSPPARAGAACRRAASNCGKRPSGLRGSSSDCRPSGRRPGRRAGPPEQMDQAEPAGQGRGTAPAPAARPPRPGSRWPRPAASLPTRLRQAAAELAIEQIARLEDNVKHLRRQQEDALDEARRLRGLEESQGQLTARRRRPSIDLARLQQSLQADAAGLGKQLAGAGAFELALTGAAADMGRAAESLDRRETGPPTQEPNAARSGGSICSSKR